MADAVINLEGRKFSPISNSNGGRVNSNSVFLFTQSSDAFTASYSGQGLSDGHLIGRMTGPLTAELVYHSRADTGALEAGKAMADFKINKSSKIEIHMQWQWLNETAISGTSVYEEL